MKFILILYIFAIILVCNGGLLRRIARSEPVESEVSISTERSQVNGTEAGKKS